jgi:hypothetical protein
MPHIENFDPALVNTPLQPLFPNLVTSFLRLSPESQVEAERIMTARSLRFELDARTTDFLFAAGAMHDGIAPFHQRFVVGLRAMERTWAATFGYYVLFQWTADNHNARLKKLGPVSQPAALGDAVELLRGAFSSAHNDSDYEWPTGLPSPSTPHPDTILMSTVNASATRVMGWILLHELGHFGNGDNDLPPGTPPKFTAHEMEHRADAWATKVATMSLQSDHQLSNLVNIPFALGAIAGINHKASADHPSAAERLRTFYQTNIEPLAATNHSLFNTALFACTTPLQGLLHLRGWSPNGFQPLSDFGAFLVWWEAEYGRLLAIADTQSQING